MESRRIKLLIVMAAAGIFSAILVSCVFGTYKMHSSAMEPSIRSNSIILFNKIAYFYQRPETGDVVVFRCNVYSEDGEGSILVRRVAATEGDRVRITDGRLYVNDQTYEGYSEQNIYLDPMSEITVGKDRVFVLSDSQTAVMDSRDKAVGMLRSDELYGKVCFR